MSSPYPLKLTENYKTFWELVCNVPYEKQVTLVRELEIKIGAHEWTIEQYNKQSFLKSTITRKAAGTACAQLPSLRAQLESARKSLWEYGIPLILTTPRVASLEIRPDMLIVQTEMLYGRAKGPLRQTWHRIGEFRIRYQPALRAKDMNSRFDTSFVWENITGNFSLGNVRVPAPQVDAGGQRTCIGTAKTSIAAYLRQKRLDLVVSVLIRYAECPHPSSGFGEFPVVDASEVPQWYRDEFR